MVSEIPPVPYLVSEPNIRAQPHSQNLLQPERKITMGP